MCIHIEQSIFCVAIPSPKFIKYNVQLTTETILGNWQGSGQPKRVLFSGAEPLPPRIWGKVQPWGSSLSAYRKVNFRKNTGAIVGLFVHCVLVWILLSIQPNNPIEQSSARGNQTKVTMSSSESSPPPSSPAKAESPKPKEDKKKSSSKKRKNELTEIEVDLNLPEPPSKKAKRLLKKGKALPAKANSDDEGGDAADGAAAGDKKKGEKKERSPYGVWVGNLRFNVTKAELRKWLIDNSGGTITDELITRVHMPHTKQPAGAPKKAQSENRGFAYVDFATFEANVAAIALSENDLQGRKLLIKDAKSFEGRPDKKETADDDAAAEAKREEEKTKSTSTKIFVGNLSFQVTEDDLHAQFEKCGKIRWVKVATFEDSGKCKGYGWVNFEEPEAAQWAVKGFVKIREEIPQLEDFIDEKDETADADGDEKMGEDGEDSEEDEKKKAKAKKAAKAEKEMPRIKMRKWWVNQLYGRNLKIELAEDDQLRYKKRFRKGGQQKQEREGGDGYQRQERNNNYERKPKTEGGGERKLNVATTDINTARLMGVPVAHQGKKTTFD